MDIEWIVIGDIQDSCHNYVLAQMKKEMHLRGDKLLINAFPKERAVLKEGWRRIVLFLHAPPHIENMLKDPFLSDPRVEKRYWELSIDPLSPKFSQFLKGRLGDWKSSIEDPDSSHYLGFSGEPIYSLSLVAPSKRPSNVVGIIGDFKDKRKFDWPLIISVANKNRDISFLVWGDVRENAVFSPSDSPLPPNISIMKARDMKYNWSQDVGGMWIPFLPPYNSLPAPFQFWWSQGRGVGCLIPKSMLLPKNYQKREFDFEDLGIVRTSESNEGEVGYRLREMLSLKNVVSVREMLKEASEKNNSWHSILLKLEAGS